MKKINWTQKLTSRKFWAAIIGFVTAVLVAFGVTDLTIEQIIAMITAVATLIAYIIGEGLVDATRIKQEGQDNEVGTSQITTTITPKGYYDTTEASCDESSE